MDLIMLAAMNRLWGPAVQAAEKDQPNLDQMPNREGAGADNSKPPLE
ncbi:hypothetical protein [Nonomuraea sp. NPDC046570]